MKLRYKNKSYFPLPRRDNNNKNKKHKLPLGRSQSLIINSEQTLSQYHIGHSHLPTRVLTNKLNKNVENIFSLPED